MTTTFPIGALVRINRYGGSIRPRDFVGQTGRVVEPWGQHASYVFVSVDGRPTPIPCLSSELSLVDPLRVTVTVTPELADALLHRKAVRLANGVSMDADHRTGEAHAAANLLTAALPEPEATPITVTLTEAQLKDLRKAEGDWAVATEVIRQIRNATAAQ